MLINQQYWLSITKNSLNHFLIRDWNLRVPEYSCARGYLLYQIAFQVTFKKVRIVVSQEERKSDPGVLTQTFHHNFDL